MTKRIRSGPTHWPDKKKAPGRGEATEGFEKPDGMSLGPRDCAKESGLIRSRDPAILGFLIYGDHNRELQDNWVRQVEIHREFYVAGAPLRAVHVWQASYDPCRLVRQKKIPG